MENVTNAILTALLQKLGQPYTIEGSVLIINPTSSPLLEILPGEWVNTEDTTQLHVDLNTFDAIDYMTGIINSLAKTI
jgi:hypothetical protein